MSKNFDKAFEELLGHEGGYKCEREDRMDWTGGIVGKGELRGTKYGISAGTYPNLAIQSLTLEEAKAIYKRDWWDRFRGDEIEYELAFQIFDADVNHGKGNGARFLQDALGLAPDGSIGPITLKALEGRDPAQVILRFLAYRLRFFTKCSTWDKHGKGWANRVANNMILATE